jgi:MFS family permease
MKKSLPNAAASASKKETTFNSQERKVVGGLTALFSLRMLGFFLVLPVLSTYAESLSGSTPVLVGLSVGIYGFTQVIFQVPFGAWSDRWGRKPVLTVGLVLFAAGSATCAMAETALILVLGRLIQGMGVVASVVVAMLADLTRDVVRTRAMVAVGVSIGCAFSVGLIFGPAAAEYFGVPTLFWLTAGLTLVAIGFLWLQIPTPPRVSHHEDVEYTSEHLFEVVTNRQLLRLDLGTFNLHMTLTAIFVTVPFILRQFISLGHQWRLFVPMLTVGMLVMLFGARMAEKPGGAKRMALLGQGLLVISLAVLALTAPASALQPGAGLTTLALGLIIFIAAFALLEPLFPALLTRLCQQTNRGTAAGIFNMSQFTGAFVGGIISGLLLETNVEALFWILAATGTAWWLSALRLEDPQHLTVLELHFSTPTREQKRMVVRRLLSVRGVEDVAWEHDRETLRVRYASETVDPDRLHTEVSAVSAADPA